MCVYLCVNRGMGLELLKTTKHAKSNCIVCTQKQTAFKQFKGSITTEYDSKMDTRYSFNLQKFKNADILSVESWHFYLGKTRLKCKKTLTLC